MDYLRRLSPGFYIGEQAIHWSMSVDHRKAGWLDERTHQDIREALLHTAILYPVEVPAYCLMPDHAHFLITGLGETVDQREAVERFRRVSNVCLRRHGVSWQKQAYDHVLREQERSRAAFPRVAAYIMQNPCKEGLCSTPEAWPFSSSLIPGFPFRSWRDEDFWEFFWDRSVRREHRCTRF